VRHRTDANQDEIIKALEKIGCKVYKMGRPVDILVGFRSLNFCLEIKNKAGKDELTDFQKKWIPAWPGQVRIVHSAEEAIECVMESYK
jgi:hypothetical protein